MMSQNSDQLKDPEALGYIQIEIFKNPSRKWLSEAWQSLEVTAEPNIFLSWLWISTWLDCFVNEMYVIEARQNHETVGLGILVKERSSLYSFIVGDVYHLHRTGDPSSDQIWIEYNDFLLRKDNADAIRDAMLTRIRYWLESRDILSIGAGLQQRFSRLTELGLIRRDVWKTTTYSLNLAALRESNKEFLSTLSKNTRYQIRRSKKRHEDAGTLNVRTAENTHEALDMFSCAAPFHIARWNHSPMGSGFTNPLFTLFHTQLIKRGIAKGFIEISHVTNGGETLAYIYNLRHKRRVYFYLSSINYARANNQLKPGLLAHYLLIEKALNDDVDIYDFMGGEAQYKKSFCSDQETLTVSSFRNTDLISDSTQILRNVKTKLFNKNSLPNH